MKYFFILACAFSLQAAAKVQVVATLPDLGWAVEQIGGDLVSVKSLLKGTEDPHHVDTIPEFIRLVADSDLVVSVGMELEEGWIPKVISRSGNAKVQKGAPGYCEAGLTVTVLEKPTGPIDRSMGDVHPGGNPHYWLSPLAFAESGEAIRQSLVQVDPLHAAQYEKGLKAFQAQMRALALAGQKRLGGMKPILMEYHREFSYFFNVYGLKAVDTIEEKPGVMPSAGRLAQVSLQAKARGVQLALAGPYANKKILERFQQASNIPVKVVPTSMTPGGAYPTYESVQNAILEAVIANGKKAG